MAFIWRALTCEILLTGAGSFRRRRASAGGSLSFFFFASASRLPLGQRFFLGSNCVPCLWGGDCLKGLDSGGHRVGASGFDLGLFATKVVQADLGCRFDNMLFDRRGKSDYPRLV